MEEIEKELLALQAQLSIAIETDDLVQAHELEIKIDLLQNQITRLQAK